MQHSQNGYEQTQNLDIILFLCYSSLIDKQTVNQGRSGEEHGAYRLE